MKNIDCLMISHAGMQPNIVELSQGFLKDIEQPKPVFNAAIAYLGTYLTRKQLSFEYVCSYEDEKNKLEELLKENILCIGISTTFCHSIDMIIEMVDFVKKRNNTSKIIIGGAYIVTCIKQFSKAQLNLLLRKIGADFYINTYKGEVELSNIIESYKNQQDILNIPNLIINMGNNFIFTEERVVECPLENNTVDWTLFKNNITSIVPVRTALSCPYKCAYCSFHVKAGKYSNISINAIEKELNTIKNIPKVKMVNFIDDSFNIPSKRFKEILRMMIKNKYSFKWHSYIRCQDLDEETVKLMRESGCQGVIIGFESGSQKILNNMNKNLTIKHYYQGHSLLKKHGIITIGMFIIGFPGETESTINETISFIDMISPTFYHAHTWICDTSTPVWEQRIKYGLKYSLNGWSHKTMNSEVAKKQTQRVINSVKKSTHMSIYYTNIFHMLEKGWTIEEIKELLEKSNSQNRLANSLL